MSAVRKRQAALLLVAVVAASSYASVARADEDEGAEPREPDAPPPPKKDEPFATKPGYAQIIATMMGGTGLRFNNLPVTPDRVFAAIDKRQRTAKKRGGAA